jgi:hypothetical protein
LPTFSLGFRNDRQHFYKGLGHIVKHPNVVADPKPELGTSVPTQTFDAALSGFGWQMPQMSLDCVSHFCLDIRL